MKQKKMYLFAMLGLLTVNTSFAGEKMLIPDNMTSLKSPGKKISIINNSENFSMQIGYIACQTNECAKQIETDIPNAKTGKNYIQFDGDFAIILKVTEKDASGNIGATSIFEENYITGCSNFTPRYAKQVDTLILDDMHGADIITCSQSVSSQKQ